MEPNACSMDWKWNDENVNTFTSLHIYNDAILLALTADNPAQADPTDTRPPVRAILLCGPPGMS